MELDKTMETVDLFYGELYSGVSTWMLILQYSKGGS